MFFEYVAWILVAAGGLTLILRGLVALRETLRQWPLVREPYSLTASVEKSLVNIIGGGSLLYLAYHRGKELPIVALYTAGMLLILAWVTNIVHLVRRKYFSENRPQ